MKSIRKKMTGSVLIAVTAIAFLTSCNKDVEQFADIPLPVLTTAKTIGDSINSIPRDTLFYKILLKGGLLPIINNRSNNFTIYVPDSNAVKQFINGFSLGVVPVTAFNDSISRYIASASFPAANAAAIASYAIVPQAFPTTSIPAVFPNFPLPTLLNPAPTLSAFLRLDVFPSVLNGNYVNNIPIVQPNIITGNGVIHHTVAVLSPPQRAVWERINTDADLTIFKAAILRADSGTVTPPATAIPTNLVSLMSSIGTNLTVFTPNNAALRAFLSPLTGIPNDPSFDATFIGFLGSNFITTRLIKGLVVYHIFDNLRNTLSPTLLSQRPGRAFSVNFPTVSTGYKTLLSSADSIGITYPSVTLMATFAGPFVSSATVKGVANPTAANLLLNPTPDSRPSYGATPPAAPITYTGTSDQLYTNAVLHKIDQLLRPQ